MERCRAMKINHFRLKCRYHAVDITDAALVSEDFASSDRRYDQQGTPHDDWPRDVAVPFFDLLPGSFSHLKYLTEEEEEISISITLCLAVDSARTAVGRSTVPLRQSGTRCLMNLEILTVLTVLNGS